MQNVPDNQEFILAYPEESIENDENKNLKKIDQKFGFDFFNNKPSMLRETYNDVPLMSDYQLSINDELELTITGSKKALYRARINLGGSIQIPEVGEINLSGLTLSEADEKIRQIISGYFVGAKSVLSIRKSSLKKISIIGSIKKPGTYMVNPYTTVSQAINYAGGLEDNASLRTIEVLSFEGQKTLSDLYQFLIFGDREQDLSLQNGDTVFIRPTSNFVKVYGEIHRPMLYEYIEGDDFSDLVEFAQGPTNNANLEEAAINILSGEKIITQQIDLLKEINEEVIESFLVPSKLFLQNKDIEIIGQSVRTGFIPQNRFSTLGELIDTLQFSQDIYPFFFKLEQTTEDGLLIEKLNFSLFDKDAYESIILKKNVKISFYSRSQVEAFNDEENLTLDEEIISDFSDSYLRFIAGNETFNLPFASKYNVKPIVDYLGLGNKIDLVNGSLTNSKGSFFEDIFSEKYDFTDGTVIIFPKLSTSETILVSIEGEVLFPGSYEVNKNVSLNDLYLIAGGFTNRADQRAILFSRESIREKERRAFKQAKDLVLDAVISSIAGNSQQTVDPSILTLIDSISDDDFQGRLAGNLSLNSTTSMLTSLENGDSIKVPAKTNTISVIGEVLSPTSMVLNDGALLSDYIEESGGYTRFADKKNVYIIKSDGTSVSANSGLFKNQYYLKPGDTIVVPRNIEKISTIPLLSAATKIIADLAFSAASLNVLNN
tara:strand:- start:2177 stop:4324 length:2148 start_codon:yes stop_codon:yes gene_type:complete